MVGGRRYGQKESWGGEGAPRLAETLVSAKGKRSQAVLWAAGSEQKRNVPCQVVSSESREGLDSGGVEKESLNYRCGKPVGIPPERVVERKPEVLCSEANDRRVS